MAGPREQDADKKRHRDDGDEQKRSHETVEENGWRPCPKLRGWRRKIGSPNPSVTSFHDSGESGLAAKSER